MHITDQMDANLDRAQDLTDNEITSKKRSFIKKSSTDEDPSFSEYYKTWRQFSDPMKFFQK